MALAVSRGSGPQPALRRLPHAANVVQRGSVVGMAVPAAVMAAVVAVRLRVGMVVIVIVGQPVGRLAVGNLHA